jgi:hypothetical protein
MSFLSPRSIARLGTLTWFVCTLLVAAALLAKHVVALPAPSPDELLSRSLASLRRAQDRDKWLVIHVLYAECRCSQGIVTHLVSSPRPAGVHELVLWVGRQAPSSALSERFQVRRVVESELAQMGISAAPLLVLLKLPVTDADRADAAWVRLEPSRLADAATPRTRSTTAAATANASKGRPSMTCRS